MRFLKLTSVTIALALSSSVNAAIISGSHTLQNGNEVNLSGLEWLDWKSTEGLTRLSVESQLESGGDLEGWRYATRSEFETLFDSLWGDTNEGWHESNKQGGNWLAANFGDMFGSATAETGSNVFFGADGECATSTSASCWGKWQGDNLSGDSQRGGWFSDSYGLSTGISSGSNGNLNATKVARFHHALVHDITPVPLPPTVWLFGFGLVGLLSITKRNQIY